MVVARRRAASAIACGRHAGRSGRCAIQCHAWRIAKSEMRDARAVCAAAAGGCYVTAFRLRDVCFWRSVCNGIEATCGIGGRAGAMKGACGRFAWRGAMACPHPLRHACPATPRLAYRAIARCGRQGRNGTGRMPRHYHSGKSRKTGRAVRASCIAGAHEKGLQRISGCSPCCNPGSAVQRCSSSHGDSMRSLSS